MIKTKAKDEINILVESIIEGIQKKKGKDILSLNLGKINSTVCDYFIICHGTSNTHVDAIAQSVEETVKKKSGNLPARREGYTNAEWILLDYLDVVVHIFQEPVRNFYQIEDLWADAPLEKIDS